MCVSERSSAANWNLWRKVRASNNTVIPNQCALLSWESPSNSRLLNVIQTVLFVPFSGIHLREIVLLTRRLPRQCAHWLAMTGNSPNSNLSILIRSTIFDIFHIIPARGGNGNADHGNSDKFFLSDGRIFNKFVP